ncbi:MAG TPA: CtsR family transcriptional regulator [Clostridiaceae bacterium]|nr:CtsR family transcriptional regulator [Clostridiaceae bacterium]
MSNISDRIERMIDDLLDRHDGTVEISRNRLAEEISVVPSQISYVLSTRFTSSHGYVVESRRGGGGSITIRRINTSSPARAILHLVQEMPESNSQQQACQIISGLLRSELIDEPMAEVFKAAMSDLAYRKVDRQLADQVRSQVLQNTLAVLATLV